MRKVYIYGLKDPKDGRIRYVGKSNSPTARFKEHLIDRANEFKRQWVADLKADGLQPEMVILQETDEIGWVEAEKEWIAKGREANWGLTNIANGGEGINELAQTAFIEPYLSVELRDEMRSMPFEGRVQVGVELARQMLPYVVQELAKMATPCK